MGWIALAFLVGVGAGVFGLLVAQRVGAADRVSDDCLRRLRSGGAL